MGIDNLLLYLLRFYESVKCCDPSVEVDRMVLGTSTVYCSEIGSKQ